MSARLVLSHIFLVLGSTAALVAGCTKETSVQAAAEPLCVANEYSCLVNTLRVCNDSHSGWLDVDTCEPGTRCDALNKTCTATAAGGAGGAGSAGTSAGGTSPHGGQAGAPSAGGNGGSNLAGGASAGSAGAPVNGCDKCDPTLEECYKGSRCISRQKSLAGGYSIDVTEVTRAQYQAWLATGPNPSAEPHAHCAWNTSYVPACSLPLTSKGNFPVGCVDWCDAHAYCEGVGKRLCGKIGGGTTPPAAFADASQSQWYNACSSGGVNAYPYGKTESQTACDGKNSGNASTVAVGSLKGCQSTAGGYDGIWDMSGNAAEWEDSCEATVGDQDSCHIRGGSFLNYGALSSCTVDYSQARNTNGFSIGFRCCAP